MLHLERIVESQARASQRLTLIYADRCKSRLRARLDDDGQEVGIFLPRGTILRGGQMLQANDGKLIEIIAAPEELMRVRAAPDAKNPRLELLRAAYHLGNRHIPIQILVQHLLLERDAVLSQMLTHLGLCVDLVVAAFEPEAGAYGGGHRHDHDRDAKAGMLGELLSRQAHEKTAPDLSKLRFEAAP